MNPGLQTLFTSCQGQGEPLLMLHGWGMNHYAWTPVKQALQGEYQVLWVDLPGHGLSVKQPLLGPEQAVDLLIPLLPDSKIHVLGWSLGGLLAQHLAHRVPEQVASLTLVATSPSFVQRENWNHAMPKELLETFYQDLQTNFTATLKRFLLLQFMGVKGGQSLAKEYFQQIINQPPDSQALQQGLQILLDCDYRGQRLHCPVHWILGKKDKLVPVAVADDLKQLTGVHQVSIIDGAGHAPFITHPDLFMDVMTQGTRTGRTA